MESKGCSGGCLRVECGNTLRILRYSIVDNQNDKINIIVYYTVIFRIGDKPMTKELEVQVNDAFDKGTDLEPIMSKLMQELSKSGEEDNINDGSIIWATLNQRIQL